MGNSTPRSLVSTWCVGPAMLPSEGDGGCPHISGRPHPPQHLHKEQPEQAFMTNMATGVAELGVAVYDALDWSVNTDSSMERTLSPELERLLDVMTSGEF